MKALIFKISCFFLAIALISFVKSPGINFDEGMYPLSELSKLDLEAAGLKIPQREIYNPDSVGLVDALVNVGGCTGSFVSDQGLIITNHHCAFSAVQQASTPEHDYLRNGFMAKTLSDEIEAKGLTCRITDSYEDVSDQILTLANQVENPGERLKVIQEKIKALERSAEAADSTITAEVAEMFIGKSYVLFRYKIIRDVRLVYVPQQAIGEFGGEKDNWMWPRHTGDFSFMRAYVAKDGSSAPYAKDNVPYQPKKHIKINANGINEGDFTFILGYPGKTFRNYPWQYINYQKKYQLPYVSGLYAFQNQIMEKIGKQKGRATELALATRIKRNANVLKNYQGKLKGLNNLDLVEQKESTDHQLISYIHSDVQLKKQFGGLMDDIDLVYQQMNANAYRDLWFTCIYDSSSLLRVARTINDFKQQILLKPYSQREAFYSANAGKLERALNRIYESYDYDVDVALFREMVGRANRLPLNQKIKVINYRTRGFNTEAQSEEFVNNLFQFSRLKDQAYVKDNLFRNVTFILNYKDPILNFEEDLRREKAQCDQEQEAVKAALSALLAGYVKVKEMYQQKNFLPDANSTLRLTYGSVQGFSPADGTYSKPFTTIKGIIEKGKSGDENYQYPSIIKQLWEHRDFGEFKADTLNDVPVCFLYNMDTTGGNSGSPVLNAYGELVGVNFDRAYEATINDYAWNQNYSRSIGVDIRYVLWVAAKIDHAERVVNEILADQSVN